MNYFISYTIKFNDILQWKNYTFYLFLLLFQCYRTGFNLRWRVYFDKFWHRGSDNMQIWLFTVPRVDTFPLQVCDNVKCFRLESGNKLQILLYKVIAYIYISFCLIWNYKTGQQNVNTKFSKTSYYLEFIIWIYFHWLYNSKTFYGNFPEF